MRLIRILKRESPVVVAREVLWRARREWNKKCLPGRLERTAPIKFRCVPFYSPNVQNLSECSKSLIVDFANEIRAGRFPFLGYGTARLGTPPQWNRDFVSGKEWPYLRCESRECVHNDGSDVKVPFELSRLQFLPVLGKAHVLTGKDAYRQVAKDLVSYWIRSNPAPIGVNWTIAMEAALRAMSICFLLNLLAPFRREEQNWLTTVTHSLVQHLLYIEANLEFSHLISSNHYLSDVVGLYCLSVFLDGKGMAARRSEYRGRIEAEMARQVYEDGGDYEASTGYHVLVTQLFTTALLLMRAERASTTPVFFERLRSMFRFLNAVASPSGELPHVGDCDDGRTELLIDDIQQMLLLPVSERNSMRISSLLGLGQRLFGEGKDHDGEDAVWHALTSTSRNLSTESPINSVSSCATKVLPKSGIGVLRQGSVEILFFAIPNGIFGKGSHTHNDKLSFVLRVGGREVLCDSGTGCYTRDVTTRNRFRSTAAHNTLRIDGAEQNRIFPGPLGLFILGNEAAVSPIETGRGTLGRFLRASHAGYQSLGVMHTRTIRAVDAEPAFVIEDKLEGDGVHDFELHFQLAPHQNAEVTPIENGILCRLLGEAQVELVVTGSVLVQAEVCPSLISSTYGATVPASRVRVWGRTAVPARITTQIWWADAAETVGASSESPTKINSRDAVAEGVCQA